MREMEGFINKEEDVIKNISTHRVLYNINNVIV